MRRNAKSVQMSFNITDSEREQAEKATICFKHAVKLLKKASEHLNIMKTSFKDNPEIPSEDIMKARAAIRRYRDQCVENFNEFKNMAFRCVSVMQIFGSDTQIIKLMKSFINSVDELEDHVNKFVDLFNDLQSKEFTKKIVTSIEDIQKKCDEIKDLSDDRIRNYIQENVLASSWVDTVGNQLDLKIEKKKPVMIDIFEKYNTQTDDALKERQNIQG